MEGVNEADRIRGVLPKVDENLMDVCGLLGQPKVHRLLLGVLLLTQEHCLKHVATLLLGG